MNVRPFMPMSQVRQNPTDSATKAMQLLQARNDQLVSILEMGESGVFYAEPDGVVSHINHALQRMFVIDDSWRGALTLEVFENHLCAMLDASEPLRKPITSMLAQLALSRAHLSKRFVQVIKLVKPRPAVIQIGASSTLDGGSVFYFRDVTVEFEVDRMKSEFLSTAAHELRTPLASIYGFAELMVTRVMPPEKQRELLQTVHRQAQLLINLVNELLDLSRIEARQGKDFHRQHCSVESIVRETVKGLLVKGDKRQVDLDLSFGKERILVDPEKTMQALLNVLSNAFKYSPLGGSIEVGTLLGTGERSGEVGIRVTDHGLGMSPEHQLRVFDRFFRAEPSGAIPGTGLGMSLVKEITELQEGQVQIQSELGRGTAVTLWFPVVSDFLLSRPLPGMDERL
jgi:signal transduction histidine kinase